MHNIQEIFNLSYGEYCTQFNPTIEQAKAAYSIMNCKSGKLGCNISLCEDCGHLETHNNSCRNRHCPCCQAVLKELWIDKRKSEVIDAPYFHVVFTLPAELNPLIYANQALLYSLLHKCVSETLLELSADQKYLGAVPGIIQILHTWGQELNFHPHMHCIVAGAGLTKAKQLKLSSKDFFIPVKVLASKFRGKFLARLQEIYVANKLIFSSSCKEFRNSYVWSEFRDSLYTKQWIPFIKETFNGFGNAIDYLGRYTHRIAISNSRIKTVTNTHVTFTAKDYRTNETNDITISHVEFIRRFLMHVLPSGFQKIRYYGFLSNRYKKINLKLIFKLTGKQLFKSLYSKMSTDELLLTLWNINIHLCPNCGCNHFRQVGRTYHLRN
jgi:hypothetical protein